MIAPMQSTIATLSERLDRAVSNLSILFSDQILLAPLGPTGLQQLLRGLLRQPGQPSGRTPFSTRVSIVLSVSLYDRDGEPRMPDLGHFLHYLA
eukprot:COSAG01_NODE_5010_length_4543_cov_12.105536_2_plen_94_part_00